MSRPRTVVARVVHAGERLPESNALIVEVTGFGPALRSPIRCAGPTWLVRRWDRVHVRPTRQTTGDREKLANSSSPPSARTACLGTAAVSAAPKHLNARYRSALDALLVALEDATPESESPSVNRRNFSALTISTPTGEGGEL
jgi:hypothetical protein